MTVTPIVLAAGASRRMGAPKALAPFDGETCLSLVLRACAEGGVGEPVVVLGHEAEAIRATLPEGTRAPFNPRFLDSGPAESLRIGLEHLPDEARAFLLFPVDFPLVTGEEVARLVLRWRETGRRIVVPSHDMRRGHPALFDRALEPAFRDLPRDEPLFRVLRDHDDEIEHVTMPDPWVVTDMDTPEAYESCLAAYRSRQP